jgi:hypothetical protein
LELHHLDSFVNALYEGVQPYSPAGFTFLSSFPGHPTADPRGTGRYKTLFAIIFIAGDKSGPGKMLSKIKSGAAAGIFVDFVRTKFMLVESLE